MSARAHDLAPKIGIEKGLDLLRGHVRQGSSQHGRLGLVGRVRGFREVEVEQLRTVIECEQDIPRLDVPVEGLHPMGIVQRTGQDHGDPGRALGVGPFHREPVPQIPRGFAAVQRRVLLLRVCWCDGAGAIHRHVPKNPGQLWPLGRPYALHDLIERQPGAVRHRQPAQPLVGLKCHGIDRNDVGVIERSLGLGFLAPVKRDLQHHALAAQREVPGQKNPGRASLANQ